MKMIKNSINKLIMLDEERAKRAKNSNVITAPFTPLSDWGAALQDSGRERLIIESLIGSYPDEYSEIHALSSNCIDALEFKYRLLYLLTCLEEERLDEYIPKAVVTIDACDQLIQFSDNGFGLSLEETIDLALPFLSRKHSYKSMISCDLRGEHGTDFAFLVFSSNNVRMTSKGPDGFVGVDYLGGNTWLHSDKINSSLIAMPTKNIDDVLNNFDSGTSVSIVHNGNNPNRYYSYSKYLDQLSHVLLTQSALGFLDLTGKESWAKNVNVLLQFRHQNGEWEEKQLPFHYPLPHETDGFDFLDLSCWPSGYGPPIVDAYFRYWSFDALFDPKYGIGRIGGIEPLLIYRPHVYGFFAKKPDIFKSFAIKRFGDSKFSPYEPGIWVAVKNAVLPCPVRSNQKRLVPLENNLYLMIQLEIPPKLDIGHRHMSNAIENSIGRIGWSAYEYFTNLPDFQSW